MDLNASMVELYKKRKNAATNKQRHGKKPKVESEDKPIPKQPREDARESQQRLSAKPRTIDELLSINYKPTSTLDQLHGCHEASKKLIRYVEGFKRLIARSSKNFNRPILINGSSGLGKTSLVEATANHTNLRIIRVALEMLSNRTRNEFEEILKTIENHSISNQPAIVLFDDLNTLKDRDELKPILKNTISNLLIGKHHLLVICTTELNEIPSNLRFFPTIHLKRLDTQARQKILETLCKEEQIQLSSDGMKELAIKTPSFTAADLKSLFLLAYCISEDEPDLQHFNEAIDEVKLSLKEGTHLIGERPTTTWSDIGGLDVVRQAFQDILRQIRKGNLECQGIALYGPPGCGKTMAAQAMANEGGFNFISIKPAELLNKYLGETERNIRKVFAEAKEYEPCMIYFDEFDGLCGTRGSKDIQTSAIQTLLAEMDGFAKRGKSIILASTNRLEDIDPAMRRPGRLSKKIYVGPPDQKARQVILSVITSRLSSKIDDDVDMVFWAKRTEDLTGADLAYLISEAEKHACREVNESERAVIHQAHLELAFKEIKSDLEYKSK